MADGIVEYVLRLRDSLSGPMRKAAAETEHLGDESRRTTRQVDRLGDESTQTARQVGVMAAGNSKAATATRALGGGMRLAGTAVAGFAASLAAIGFAGAIAGAVSLSQEVADLRNDLGDAATRSGLTAETLQGLRLAAEGAGLSFGELTPGLDQFGARLSQARRGTGATADAFRALGVDVTDAAGNLRDTDAVLRETLSSLQAVESPAERSALAVEALGRSGGRLLQALSGSELDAFAEQARLFGVEYGPAAADAAGRWQRATAELGLVVNGLKAALVDTFGVGADSVEQFTQAIVVGRAIASEFADGAGAAFDAFGRVFTSLFEVLGAQVDRLVARLRVVLPLLSGDLQGVGEALQGVTDADAAFGVAARARDAAFADAGGAVGSLSDDISTAVSEDILSLARVRADTRPTAGTAAAPGRTAIEAGAGDGPAEVAFVSGLDETIDDVSAGLDVVGDAAVTAADQLVAGIDAMVLGLEQGAREAQRVLRLEGAQTGIGIAQTALSGNIGGALSQGGSVASGAGMATLGASLGVAGAGVGALALLGEQGADGIATQLEGFQDLLLAGIEELPELIGEVLPRFAVSLVASLIPALIEAAPALFEALIFELPQAIGDAVAEAIGIRSEEGKGRIGGAARGATRGALIGAAVGGIVFGVGSGGILAAPGAAVGAKAGAAVGSLVGAARGRTEAPDRSRQASRADSTMRSMPALRPRLPAAEANPFDSLARQYDLQYGTFGRASAQTIRGAS